MINRTPSPIKSQSGINPNSESAQQPNLSDEVQYFEQISDNQLKSGYSNQVEIDQGLPGYAEKAKSGYSNNDAISGYGNVTESNQLSQPAITQVGDSTQSLQNLIITIKDDATGMIKSSFKVCPLLSQEEAALIEQQCGVVLKKDTNNTGMFNGFLGGGAFGKVYVAKQEGSNPVKYVAIKIIQGNQKALAESKHESGLQLKLTKAINPEDSQLMPIIGIGENLNLAANEAEKLYIVMPLAGMGSGEGLRKDLNELKKTNTSPEFYRLLNLQIAKSMLLGLYQMHRNNIYHLDMKPANMMITGDGKVQLSDFGTSEEVVGNPPSLRVGKDQQSGRFIGNGDSTYFPQERTFDEGSTFDPAKADIYAAGLVLFEFLTGREFNGSNPLNNPIFSNVVKGGLEELTLRLLNPQSVSRISLEDALNHPCLTVAEAHDEGINKVVLGFLGNYVKYTQSKARGDLGAIDQLTQSLKDNLNKSQLQTENLSVSPNLVTNPNDPFILNPTIKVPFANRPDVQEQLQTYLPLKCSLGKIISNPEKQMVSLIDKTNEFLVNPNTALLLLLADGGAGKSLFVQWLVNNILEQKVPYDQIKSPNGKPYFPLYVTLSNIKNPHKVFAEGLNLNDQSIYELQQTHQVLLILDGFDEQSYQWKNLYNENKLYNYPGLKVIVTSRINALPSIYSEYFVARQNDGKNLGYQELYLQPFQASQIDTYVANYISQHRARIQEQVEQKQLPVKWLEAKYVQEQINSISGLKDLMQTPLLSRLVLIALPQLSQATQQTSGSRKITRVEVYTAFMRQWIITQMVTKQGRLPSSITSDEINQVLAFGQKIALSMYKDNRSAQLNVGLATFGFNPRSGKYQQNPSKYGWFDQGKQEQTLLPLQEAQTGTYKFVHLSMQEYLLAGYLTEELIQSTTLKDLHLNQLALTIEEKDRPILYFLGDMASNSKATENNLFGLIEQTKTDKSQSRAGANAISILAASSVQLVGRDFSNTSLPYSDLSGSVLFNADFRKADLFKSNLKGAKLNNSNFKEASLSEIRLGQYPMYRLEQLIRAISYSPDGRYLAISQRKEMILFNASTRKEVRRFGGHTNDINSISFSKDGIKVATGSSDKTCRLWDVENGLELGVLSGHTKKITSVSFIPDGRKVITGSDDKTCRLWDVASGCELGVLGEHDNAIMCVSCSPDGSIVATGSMDDTCRLWDVASFRESGVLRGHTKWVTSVSFSPDGRIVATGSTDHTCRLWDVASGCELGVLRGHSRDLHSVNFSPDGRLVATGSADKTCRLWEVESRKELGILSGHTDRIYSVIFSPDGRLVATGGSDTTCRLWDVESFRELGALRGHTGDIEGVSFSPDRRIVATGSLDKTCRLWDLARGRELEVLRGHFGGIYSVSFSPDGRFVATGSADANCRLWDVENGWKLVGVLRGDEGIIYSVSFSPDSRLVATGSGTSIGEYPTCRLWDVSSCKELAVLHGHTKSITSVSFSPDGTKLISKDTGGTNKVWLLATQLELKGDQAILVPQKSHHTLDNITASYEDKKVTLSQKVMASSNTSTSVESFTIEFPDKIKGISLSKDNLENKVMLAVVMGKGIAFYAKELSSPLNAFLAISVSMVDQALDAREMDVSGSIGLSQSNYDLLAQLGATGKPAILDSNLTF